MQRHLLPDQRWTLARVALIANLKSFKLLLIWSLNLSLRVKPLSETLKYQKAPLEWNGKWHQYLFLMKLELWTARATPSADVGRPFDVFIHNRELFKKSWLRISDQMGDHWHICLHSRHSHIVTRSCSACVCSAAATCWFAAGSRKGRPGVLNHCAQLTLCVTTAGIKSSHLLKLLGHSV